RDKFRIVAEPEIAADFAAGRAFKPLPNGAADRARHRGRVHRDQMVAFLSGQHAADFVHHRENVVVAEGAIGSARSGDDDTGEVGFKYGLRPNRGRGNACSVFRQKLLKVGLFDRGNVIIDLLDIRWIGVDTDNLKTLRREHSNDWRAKFTETNNR